MKERANIRQNIKFGVFPVLIFFNLQLMSILGRTFSLFTLINKTCLSCFINFGRAKTVVGLKVLTLCHMYFFYFSIQIYLFGKILS